MLRNRVLALASAAILAAACGSSFARPPVGTEFTYQGQLLKNGQTLNSNSDFRFTLYDGPGPTANIVGATQNVPNIPVTDGRFECTVNFGETPYTTNEERWLQVEVRNPAGGGVFSLMGDRQKLTASPFSLATRGINVDANGKVSVPNMLFVDSADQNAGTIENALLFGALGTAEGIGSKRTPGGNRYGLDFYTSGATRMSITQSGNVGIGESNPLRALHLKGNDVGMTLQDTTDADGPNARWALDTQAFGQAGLGLLRYDGVVPNSTKSIFVTNAGNVGVGTVIPAADAKVHVRNVANARCTLRIDSGATAPNYSVVGFADRGNQIWSCGLRPDGMFGIDRDGTNTFLQITQFGSIGIGGAVPVDGRALTVLGGAYCDGFQWIDVCDANAKEGFETVDPESILEKVAELPVTTWHYKGQEVTHIGPTAQDFHRIFGFGNNDTSIAAVNTNGVSLAAIQGLIKKLDAKEAEVEGLKARLAKIEAALAGTNTATASK